MNRIGDLFRLVATPLLVIGLLAITNLGLCADPIAHRDLVFAQPGDKPLKLDLYLPANKDTSDEKNAKQPKPKLFVWIHGGGWKAGSKTRVPLRVLTNDGFVVASISYRFTDTAIFPAQVFDCKAAIRWLRANAEKYGYDADWIAVGGSSAGGHLALLIGTSGGVAELEGDVGGNLDQSSQVQAVIDYYGPSDFVLRGRTHPERSYSKDGGSFIFLGGLKNGKLTPEIEKAASPTTYVGENDPPLIVFQGTNDKKVLPDQSDRIVAVYEEAGLDVTLVRVKGAGHGGDVFFKGENLERARQFLKKHQPSR